MDNKDLATTQNNSLNLEELKKKYGGFWRYDFLDFHYLYNSYFPNDKIINSLKEELSALIDCYPSTQKIIADILSSWRSEEWFNSNNLIVGNGSSELIRILNGMLDNVLLPLPSFNEYAQIENQKITFFLSDESDNFHIDTDKLLQVIKQGNYKFLILNNPNNPTGQLFSKLEIKKFLDFGINVIVDEAFIDWSGIENSCEDLIEEYNNLVIIKSLTKTTGCGGLRIGYLLTSNLEIKNYVKSKLPIWNINSIGERFLELLIENKHDFLNDTKKIIQDRDNLFQELDKIEEIIPIKSHANFIFCRTNLSAGLLENYLFEKHRIMIKAGVNQQRISSDRFFRVGIRSKEDNKKLIDGIKDFIKHYM